MWTYLTILLSLIIFFGVFFRRLKKVAGTGESEEEVKKQLEDVERVKLKPVSKKESQTVAALCEKAEQKIKSGKEEEAIKLLVQALAVDEAHEDSQHKLAMLYMNKQMFSSAAALFKRLAEVTDEAIHYSHLGLAYFNQQDLESARDAYQKAVDLDPSRPQRFVSLGQVYRSMGQGTHAAISIQKAIDLDEENVSFLLLLADIQKEVGNKEVAKELLNKVLSLDEGNEDAKILLKELDKMEG